MAYHAPEGLFDQEAYGKKIEVYISQDIQRVYTFQEYMNLTTYQTKVLHKTLSDMSKQSAEAPNKAERANVEALKAIEKHTKALNKG